MIQRILVFFLAVVAFAAHAATTIFTPDTATSITDNPERGWYFALDVSSTRNEFCNGFLQTVRDGGVDGQQVRIMMWDINPQLITTDVMNSTFQCARAGAIKVLIKLAYCNTGGCHEGRTIDQAEADIAAMKNGFYANRDVIFAVKAGVIGAWGEWHDESDPIGQGLDTGPNKIRVRNALLAAVPPEIPVLFRVPPILQVWYGTPLSASERFNGSAKSRAGFYNDCYLTGGGDSGTFPGAGPARDLTYTGTEAQQRAFASQQTDGTMFGGETCDNSDGANTQKRLNCSGSMVLPGLPGGILAEGPYYHQTFLHRGYADVFYTQWQNDAVPCYGTVTNLMGYRFQYDGLTHPDTIARGSNGAFLVTMRNYGWARLYSARQLQVRLVKSGATDIVCKFPQQLRTLPSQATSSTTMQARCSVPASATTGSYTAYLEMPDIAFPGMNAPVADYNIRPANANAGGQIWDATNRRFATGTTVTIN